MLIFGFTLACWLGLGLILTLFRFFIYFRSPTHLYTAHMFDKRTQSQMKEVFKSYSHIEDKAGLYFRTSLILAMLFPLIPLILIFNDIQTFRTGYEPANLSNDQESD